MRTQRQSSIEHSASPAPDARGLTARGCAGVIRVYQRVMRPVVPPACRFAPSCSEYAHDAVLAHGVVRGGWLAVRRLGRCNPWYPGGYDPVPGSGE